MPFFNNNELGSSINVKPRQSRLGGQRTGKIYNTINVGGKSLRLMNEKAVSARWVDAGKGVMEVMYEPNEDGNFVRALHIGPDEYIQLPPGMTAEQAINAPNYQHKIQAAINSRGGGSQPQTEKKNSRRERSRDKPKAKGFFGLDRWSAANIAVSIVVIPLWCAWKLFKLGLFIQLSSEDAPRRRR